MILSPVGEATHADPDALEHTVAGQLVHHKGGVEEKRRLVVVWHDATDEVGVGRVEGLNIKSVQKNNKKTFFTVKNSKNHSVLKRSFELTVSRASSWALKAEETVLKVFGPASFPFFFSFTT